MNQKPSTKATKTKRTESEDESDPFEFRTRQAEALSKMQFSLIGTKNTFAVGTPCHPTLHDVRACFDTLIKYNFLEAYELLPKGMVEVARIFKEKDVLISLVPSVLILAERAINTGTIDILAPNNKFLVGILHVLGWYWYRELGGPIPVPSPVDHSTVLKNKPQNAALCCPMCNHQWNAPSNLVTQRAKAYAWLRWLPKHFKEYHLWYPSVKATTAAQKIDFEPKGGK